MKSSLRLAYWPLAVSGFLLVSTNLLLAQEERPTRAVWKKWQRDISQFDAELRQVIREAKVPEEEALKKRFEEKSSGLEVVTDGYGGVVDFDAAEGTIQYVAHERFADMNIEWEFELANDTEIYWNKSTKLIPKIARTAQDGKQESEPPLFAIRIAKSDAGPFHSGDRVKLKASIDDFSRFRKDYSRAFGLMAIYYLEEGPNPVFDLRLDEAEVTLVQGAKQDTSKSEPARPEGTPEKGAGENRRNELDPLLDDTEERQLTYSPDKKLVAHLDGRLVTVWSVEEKRQLHRLVLEGRPLTAAFSPDGGSLVTADGEGNLEYRCTIKLWSLATGGGRLIAQFLGSPTHLSFSPDGSRLAAASNLNFIGSITRNPEGGIAPDRTQTGGSVHVWRVSDGSELLQVDIGLPEYTARLMEFQRAGSDDADFNKDKATDALQTFYYEAVRKRVPYRLNFSPDGQRLIGVSKSGQETILDSRTGKPHQPTSRGEQDGADRPAPAPEPKSEGKTALGNMALEFDTPASQKAGKGAIAPTGLTIVVCDSANNVLDTLVVPRDIKNGDFEFIVPKGIDEIRVFALGKRIVGIGGPGAILNPMLREMISEGLTKNYFVARSKERGGIGLVMAEIREGVLNGMSAGGAPIPLNVTGKMQKQIREDIAAGKRAPIIYRHETDESGEGFIRVLAD